MPIASIDSWYPQAAGPLSPPPPIIAPGQPFLGEPADWPVDPVLYPARGPDSLRMYVPGADEVRHLHAVGTIPGVVPLLAAARNSRGAGRIRSAGPDGTQLSFRAPASSSWGESVDCSADGIYLLRDGDDEHKWLRVAVYAAYLIAGPAEAPVLLSDRWNNWIGSDDVTAAEASAGAVKIYQVMLQNESPNTLENIVAWLDAATADLEISDDGATWVAPTTEAAGLTLPAMRPGDQRALHLKRTIAASAPSDPDILNLLYFAFDGL